MQGLMLGQGRGCWYMHMHRLCNIYGASMNIPWGMGGGGGGIMEVSQQQEIKNTS